MQRKGHVQCCVLNLGVIACGIIKKNILDKLFEISEWLLVLASYMSLIYTLLIPFFCQILATKCFEENLIQFLYLALTFSS